MAGLSQEQLSIARKSHSALLKGVESVGQNTIATAVGVDGATITKDKEKYWERFCQSAAVADCKIVPARSRCYLPEEIEPLLQLARQRMAQLQSIDQLKWDE